MYVVYVIIPYEEYVLTFESYDEAKRYYDDQVAFWEDEHPVGIAKVMQTNGVSE